MSRQRWHETDLQSMLARGDARIVESHGGMMQGTVPPDGAIRLRLPFPPSTNNLYATVGRKRVLSKRGRAFHDAVASEVFWQYCPCITLTGRVSMTIVAHCPDARVRDLSNLLKITEDALVEAGVLADDGQIDHLMITRGPIDRPLGHLLVTIEERPCRN